MILTTLIALVFIVLRFTLPMEGVDNRDIFKDLAHLYVGGLFGAAIITGYAKDSYLFNRLHVRRNLWLLAIGMTVLEVVAAIVRK
jgi:hypothetical protein